MKKRTKEAIDQVIRVLNTRTLAESVKGIFYFFGRMVSHPVGLATFLAFLSYTYSQINRPEVRDRRIKFDEYGRPYVKAKLPDEIRKWLRIQEEATYS